jgi:hypothetical protein
LLSSAGDGDACLACFSFGLTIADCFRFAIMMAQYYNVHGACGGPGGGRRRVQRFKIVQVRVFNSVSYFKRCQMVDCQRHQHSPFGESRPSLLLTPLMRRSSHSYISYIFTPSP